MAVTRLLRPAGRTVEVKRLVLIDLACDTAAEANVIGTVPGSPIVMRPFFFAYEHANSRAMVSRGDNVALGKPATANGVWGDLVPELAFDGQRADGNRHWGCANLPVWLQVDLEQTVPIDRLHLFTWFNDRRIYKYKIETSTDGEHWQTAVDRTGESRPATSAGYDERFPERPARLVRVTFTENSEGNQFGGHVVEMEVFRSRAENVEPAERLVCSLVRNETLPAARTLVQSSVIGVVPPGQLRRGFLYYVERERAHPFRPFLHYNSWYDTSWPGHAMHEAECLEVVEIFRRELIEGRGVKLECFLWDDGWDDPRTLWRIDKTRFPRGFAPLLAATEAAGAKQGFWLSPWGGYGEAKRQRVAMGKEKGFETDGGGFSIAGPKYFERFLDASRRMIDENGCNHFKYDGMNAARIEQSAAMFRLIAQLRQLQPDLFVNMTVGTWPSVYYLWHGDSTWRGAGDMGHAGKGPKREQWVTYRDLHTYHGVVRRGPLYPLNSLMTQGIAHARFGHPTANGKDRGQLRNEIRSFFASGTATQELYITPQMMTADNWDDLAEAARWSAANADVLVDTHWIGGDPAKDEIYGWASWSPRKGILALRNPSDRPAEIAIDVARAFELPSGASRKYVLKSPWEDEADRKTATVEAGDEHMFSLEPFEVLVFDATPVAE